MNRQETIEILSFLKSIFPDFYKGKDRAEHERMISEWMEYFSRESKRHVLTACFLLAKSNVHPTKEEIGEKAQELFPVSWKDKRPAMETPEDKTMNEIEIS